MSIPDLAELPTLVLIPPIEVGVGDLIWHRPTGETWPFYARRGLHGSEVIVLHRDGTTAPLPPEIRKRCWALRAIPRPT